MIDNVIIIIKVIKMFSGRGSTSSQPARIGVSGSTQLQVIMILMMEMMEMMMMMMKTMVRSAPDGSDKTENVLINLYSEPLCILT